MKAMIGERSAEAAYRGVAEAIMASLERMIKPYEGRRVEMEYSTAMRELDGGKMEYRLTITVKPKGRGEE